MSETVVDAFYNDHKALYDFLMANNQLSFAVDVSAAFRRSLVLAAASYFEHELSEVVRRLPYIYAGGNAYIRSLIERRVVARQYHTFFRWEDSNVNSFLSMFGDDYKIYCQRRLRDDQSLEDGMKAFLSIGKVRNQLVHQNFIQFSVDLTPDDIIDRFRKGQIFVQFVKDTLCDPAASTEF